MEKTGYQTSLSTLLPSSSAQPPDEEEFDHTIDGIVGDGSAITGSANKDVAKISQTLSKVVGVADREGDGVDQE